LLEARAPKPGQDARPPDADPGSQIPTKAHTAAPITGSSSTQKGELGLFFWFWLFPEMQSWRLMWWTTPAPGIECAKGEIVEQRITGGGRPHAC
jgi:hypothetical protein